MRRSRFSALGLAVRDRSGIRLGDETGMALVLALGIMLVLVVTLTTVITFTAAGARDSSRVNAGQKAYALAEAGINDALAVLNANYPDQTTPFPGPRCLLGQRAAPTGFPGTEPIGTYTCDASVPLEYVSTPQPTRPNETATWWGRIRVVTLETGSALAWVIRSTGSVPNPTGPNAPPVRRTVHAKVPVIIGPAQDVPPGVLNWLYSTTSTTFGQGVEARSPVYVRGNLLLTSSAQIYAPLYITCVPPSAPVPTEAIPCPSTGGNLTLENTVNVHAPGATVAVGGTVTQRSQNNNTIGTAAARLSEAHVVNGCAHRANGNPEPLHKPCQWDADLVFADAAGAASATSSGTKRDTIMPADPVPVPPVIDWNFWYQYGSPGPQFACDPNSVSGTPPQFDTGDGLLNVSVAGITNLTPAASYFCETLAGSLDWDVPSKTLTLKGTIFIDGSAEIRSLFPGQTALRYDGQGTIFVSGTFGLKNTKMCAEIDGSGNNCNLATNVWDPNQDALIIVAKSRGSDLPVSKQSAAGNNSVEVVSAQMQGVLGGTYDIQVTTSSTVQGPLISTDGNISLNQSTGASFPDIHFAPSGAPGNPPPPTVLLAPREFGGG